MRYPSAPTLNDNDWAVLCQAIKPLASGHSSSSRKGRAFRRLFNEDRNGPLRRAFVSDLWRRYVVECEGEPGDKEAFIEWIKWFVATWGPTIIKILLTLILL